MFWKIHRHKAENSRFLSFCPSVLEMHVFHRTIMSLFLLFLLRLVFSSDSKQSADGNVSKCVIIQQKCLEQKKQETAAAA